MKLHGTRELKCRFLMMSIALRYCWSGNTREALGKSRPSRDRRQFHDAARRNGAAACGARVAVRPDAANRRAHVTRR